MKDIVDEMRQEFIRLRPEDELLFRLLDCIEVYDRERWQMFLDRLSDIDIDLKPKWACMQCKVESAAEIEDWKFRCKMMALACKRETARRMTAEDQLKALRSK